jgi:hypothetical protein
LTRRPPNRALGGVTHIRQLDNGSADKPNAIEITRVQELNQINAAMVVLTSRIKRLGLMHAVLWGARCCIGLTLALTALASTPAAWAADAAQGERLARRWCSSCHVVAPHQKGTVAEVPPFSTIARRPNFDASKIALFLLDPHPKMPNMDLSRSEAADLAAYIATFR